MIDYPHYLAARAAVAQFEKESTTRVADYIINSNPDINYTGYSFEVNEIHEETGIVKVFVAKPEADISSSRSVKYVIIPLYVFQGYCQQTSP